MPCSAAVQLQLVAAADLPNGSRRHHAGLWQNDGSTIRRRRIHKLRSQHTIEESGHKFLSGHSYYG